MSSPHIPIGSIVRVRSQDEIAATLDKNACFEGLPFLPEMSRHCGSHVRLLRHVNKMCVNTGDITIRSLCDAVALDVGRCTGEQIGGCEMACQLIWKTAWIDPDVDGKQPTDVGSNTPGSLYNIAASAAAREPERFHCQATSLSQCTQSLPPTNIGQYVEEMQTNAVGVLTIGGYFAKKALSRMRPGGTIIGEQNKTPTAALALKIGDQVEVKSLDEIRETLDSNGCNRGLWFDPEMAQYCGRKLEVTAIIRRIVDEQTGRLVIMRQPSIVLGRLACSGLLRRFCSRSMLNFWREIWLRRVIS